MRKLNYFKTSGIIIGLFLITFSCSTTRKTAVLCPELPRNNMNIHITQKNKIHSSKIFAYSQKENDRRQDVKNVTLTSKADQKKNELNKSASDRNIPQFERISNLNMIDYKNGLIASLDKANIPLIQTYSTAVPNTEALSEAGDNEFNSSSAVYFSSKPILNSHKPVIKPAEKSKDSFIPSDKISSQQESTTRKVEGFGKAGFILSLAGIFLLPLPCGILAIIFSAISIGRIIKHPDKYRGLGFAIAGLVFGTALTLLGVFALLFGHLTYWTG